MKQAIVSIDADGHVRHASETLLVAAHPADAWRLSGELAALIDEMIIENVEWRGLETLGGEFDDYWRITLQFLDIAIKPGRRCRPSAALSIRRGGSRR